MGNTEWVWFIISEGQLACMLKGDKTLFKEFLYTIKSVGTAVTRTLTTRAFIALLTHSLWTRANGRWTPNSVLVTEQSFRYYCPERKSKPTHSKLVRCLCSSKDKHSDKSNPLANKHNFWDIIWINKGIQFSWNIQIMKRKRLSGLCVPFFSVHDSCRLKVI